MSSSKIGSRLSSDLITKAKALAAVRKYISTCQPRKHRAPPSQCSKRSQKKKQMFRGGIVYIAIKEELIYAGATIIIMINHQEVKTSSGLAKA